MIRRPTLILLACALLAAGERTARADALTAEQAIALAVSKVEGAEFEQALDLLRAAEQLTEDRAVLARIYREAGVVQEILKRPDDAIFSFFRALRCDPSIAVTPAEHKASAVRLFGIARALAAGDPDPRLLSEKTGLKLGPDRERCAKSLTSAAAATSSALAATAPAEPSSGARLAPWIASGVAVAALAAGTAFALSASSKDRECQSLTEPTAYAACDASATDRERNAALVLGAGGGAAIVAVALWIYRAVE